jgi:CheY-like chemotaxis protein
VEDNLTDATLIRTILEKGGDVRVTLAQDGIRGCQLVESHRWDLVITDFNLPGRDGIEVIIACKSSQPDTPIISTSGFPRQAHRDGAFRGGASEVLGKPIDPEELWNTARGLLEIQMREGAKTKVILAIGALPGDLEAGCGGTLIKHHLRGDEVHVLVLTVGAKGSEAEYQVTAARKASRVLGAEIHLPEVYSSQIPALDAALIQIQDAVHELEPDTVFAPSSNDVRESRQRANQAADLGTGKSTNLLCYQAASTTLEFRPTHFEDISDFLDDKMAALSHFQDQVEGRPHLHPGLSRAAARYWGRFLGYGEVEPFEVVRHNL